MNTQLETNALRSFDESYRKELYKILQDVGRPFSENETKILPVVVASRRVFLLKSIYVWWKREGAILYKEIMSKNVIDDDSELVEKLQWHLRLFLRVICETVEEHIAALILSEDILEKLENPWSLKNIE